MDRGDTGTDEYEQEPEKTSKKANWDLIKVWSDLNLFTLLRSTGSQDDYYRLIFTVVKLLYRDRFVDRSDTYNKINPVWYVSEKFLWLNYPFH